MKVVFVHDGGVVGEFTPRCQCIPPRLGILGFDGLLVEPVTDAVEQLLHLQVERLVAVETEAPRRWRQLATPGTGDGCLDRLLFGFDVQAVHGRVVLLLRLARKHGDVAGDHGRAASAALAVFNERLGFPLLGEPVGVTLPEIRRRDGFVDASAGGDIFEAVEEPLVAEVAGTAELAPECIRLGSRVLLEPLRDVGDGPDEMDVVLAALAVGAHLERVLAVGDIARCEVVEFAATQSSLELQGDEGGVAVVAACLQHGLDIIVEREHVGLIRRGVIVSRGLRRDPLVGVGYLVTARDVLGEHAERDAVVSVGFLAPVVDVVGVVNPADDGLGRAFRRIEGLLVVRFVEFTLECGGERCVGVFANSCAVAEELLVAVVAVVFPAELQFVTEVDEEVAVAVGPTAFGGFDALAQRLDGVLRIGWHMYGVYPSAGKGLAESPPPASANPFNSALTPSAAATPTSSSGASPPRLQLTPSTEVGV